MAKTKGGQGSGKQAGAKPAGAKPALAKPTSAKPAPPKAKPAPAGKIPAGNKKGVLTILFCPRCRYRPRAEEIAADAQRIFGLKTIIQEGKTGQFDVLLDGEMLVQRGGNWWRWIFGRAPQSEDVLAALGERLHR
jgi:hypothetical protein